MPGLWFEEFEVGQQFRHVMRRTITEADNVFFSRADAQPGGAAPRRGILPDRDGIRPAHRQQRLHARADGRHHRRRHDARHHRRQSRLGRGALPQAAVPRRHGARRIRSPVQAREQVAAGPGYRRIPPPRLQPEERAGRALPPLRPDEGQGRHERAAAVLAVRPGRQRKEAAEGQRERRRCADPRPGGFRRRRPPPAGARDDLRIPRRAGPPAAALGPHQPAGWRGAGRCRRRGARGPRRAGGAEGQRPGRAAARLPLARCAGGARGAAAGWHPPAVGGDRDGGGGARPRRTTRASRCPACTA